MFSYLHVEYLFQLEGKEIYPDKSQSIGGKICFGKKLHC